jgi:hypothetical protein
MTDWLFGVKQKLPDVSSVDANRGKDMQTRVSCRVGRSCIQSASVMQSVSHV